MLCFVSYQLHTDNTHTHTHTQDKTRQDNTIVVLLHNYLFAPRLYPGLTSNDDDKRRQHQTATGNNIRQQPTRRRTERTHTDAQTRTNKSVNRINSELFVCLFAFFLACLLVTLSFSSTTTTTITTLIKKTNYPPKKSNAQLYRQERKKGQQNTR